MLRLRPYCDSDACEIVKWIGDERLFRLWSADRYDKWPVTAEDINRQYAGRINSDAFFPMTAYDEEGIKGHLIIRFTDSEKKTARFGFVIVDSSVRGKGYGREMLLLAMKYAFEMLLVDKVTLGVFDVNEKAERCYRSVGFVRSEEQPGEKFSLNNGEMWTCIELEITK